MRMMFTFILIIILAMPVYSQNYKQVKIYIDSPRDIEILQKAGLEFDHPQLTKDKAVIVFVNDSEISKLQMINFRYDILIDNWYEHYNNLPKLTENEKAEFIDKSKREMNVSGFGYGSMGGFIF